MRVGELLRHMVEVGASDLHLKVGQPPVVRVDGDLLRTHFDVLTASDTEAAAFELLPEKKAGEFRATNEADFGYTAQGMGRFRINCFLQRGLVGVAIRRVRSDIPTFEELLLPPAANALASEHRGLVLVTGPTGSGKSTTLAALVDVVNGERDVHIMTVEDPIEFLHKHKRALVNQREVGHDTHSFAEALKHVLRQDPDVILVGEMRDLETIQTALTAAETGHLVFATLHTQDAPQTIDRIIDVFPPFQQQQVRVQLAVTLQGVVTQQLLPTSDGRGRIVGAEVLIATPAVRNLVREAKIHQIYSTMQAGGRYGMQTMDQHLVALVRAGKITYETAAAQSHDVDELKNMLGRDDTGQAAPTRPAAASGSSVFMSG